MYICNTYIIQLVIKKPYNQLYWEITYLNVCSLILLMSMHVLAK